jgi:DNA-binding Lrp family transcriptional regulator
VPHDPASSATNSARSASQPGGVVDRNILAELQQEGRLSITELAARLPLSVSRCQRRLRELERNGAIRTTIASPRHPEYSGWRPRSS